MKKSLLLVVFAFICFEETKAQGVYSNSPGNYAQAGLNIGVEVDPLNKIKINDFISNDAQEVNSTNFKYGASLKVFQRKAGLIVGCAITKSGGVNKVAMSGTKFNLGFNYSTGTNHYKNFQLGCYFNWGVRNYYFNNTLYVPTSSLTPSTSVSNINLIQFHQRSLGAIITTPSITIDNYTAFRIVLGVEYNLNSSYWNAGDVRIPQYGGFGFVENVMFQFDFGKTNGR